MIDRRDRILKLAGEVKRAWGEETYQEKMERENSEWAKSEEESWKKSDDYSLKLKGEDKFMEDGDMEHDIWGALRSKMDSDSEYTSGYKSALDDGLIILKDDWEYNIDKVAQDVVNKAAEKYGVDYGAIDDDVIQQKIDSIVYNIYETIQDGGVMVEKKDYRDMNNATVDIKIAMPIL